MSDAIPRYEHIRTTLAARIRAGVLSDGLILTEGAIAELFGTSRAPVRQALELLHQDHLIHRFQGRGYMVGPTGDLLPIRQKLDRQVLGLDEKNDLITPSTNINPERILNDVKFNATMAMAFGQYRILGTTLAQEFGVGRQIALEVLLRLREQRILWRDGKGHWMVGPLTAKSISDDYQIRELLEPTVLLETAHKFDHDAIAALRMKVQTMQVKQEEKLLGDFVELENQLHKIYFGQCRNDRLYEIIQRSQLPSLVNHVFLNAIWPRIDLPELQEHLLVIDHLLDHAFVDAASALKAHLKASSGRILKRLKSISVLPLPHLPSYIIRQ